MRYTDFFTSYMRLYKQTWPRLKDLKNSMTITLIFYIFILIKNLLFFPASSFIVKCPPNTLTDKLQVEMQLLYF